MNSNPVSTLHWCTAPTPVGHLLVGVTGDGVAVVEFLDDPNDAVARLHQRFPTAQLQDQLPADDPTVAAVRALVVDATPAAVTVDAHGTEFQQAVWQALLDIPSGETRTYTEVAAAVGRPRAVRAVASACARNPVAVVVPCHRVVRSDGGLGGYAYGLAVKQHLLAVEQQRAAAT